jgi:molybdenum cofactor biosynthesis enzyme MoaA
MATLNSLSLFVGTGQCDASCAHCAGKQHRKYAPKKDGIIDEEIIRKTVESCYEHGARNISISSSGEPTLSPLAVTRTLKLLHEYAQRGMAYSHIRLYSNGIRIGQDRQFCETYLPRWCDLGLTSVYVTVHDTDPEKNALIYRVASYPPLETVIQRIHDAGFILRANMVMSDTTINTAERFTETARRLLAMGVDKISAWPLRNDDDEVDSLHSPPEEEIDRMESWALQRQNVCVYRENSRIRYQQGEKLTLFPDGTLSNKWCNNKK